MVASSLPRKPRESEPCNGCGHCCVEEPCALAAEFLSCTTGPCVALEYTDGRTYCGLVRNPIQHLLGRTAADEHAGLVGGLQAHLAGVLRLGAGCDASDASDT